MIVDDEFSWGHVRKTVLLQGKVPSDCCGPHTEGHEGSDVEGRPSQPGLQKEAGDEAEILKEFRVLYLTILKRKTLNLPLKVETDQYII